MSEQQQPERSIRGRKDRKNEGKYHFSDFPLYEHKTPEFREKQGGSYVYYGEDNAYPDYLVYLYNRSATHNAIVTGKTRFVLGRGWIIKDGVNDPKLMDFMRRVNPSDDLNELSYKCILDRLIFGGYALRVIWMGGKIVSIYHQPFQTIRTNVDVSEFYISSEWTEEQSTKAYYKSRTKFPDDVKIVEPFNPNSGTGEQILYITDYRPQLKIYPLPEYLPCNAAIETDIEIDNFHLNNIKSGFAAGTMITLFNGKPPEDEAKDVEIALKRKFTGTDNAGNVVVNFAEINETPPQIDGLRSNDLDKQYEQLAKATLEKIFIGHSVTSPMLFGVKSEGQLGGRNEMDIAWQLMNINYVNPRRDQFESDINYLLKFAGYTNKVELQPLKKLKVEISDAILTANLDREELRDLIKDTLDIELKQTVAPEVQMSTQHVDFDSILINKFKAIGESSDLFEFVGDALSDDEKILIDYLKGKKKIDPIKAQKDLKIDVAKILKKLIENNVIAGTTNPNGSIDIEEINVPDQVVEVETKWRYDWVDPSLKDNPEEGISKSRTFCRDLLLQKDLYTREQIDNLNNEMKSYNVDVWKYRGGWYTVPNTDGLLHTPQCRHTWKQVLVRRKR
jgi:hypothetical protein